MSTKSHNPAIPEPKKYKKPSGKLQTANVGIKSILNPPKKQVADNVAEQSVASTNTPVTAEALDHAWKSYILKLQREKKSSLYSTLNSCNHRLGSDLVITIDTNNSNQEEQIDAIKPQFLGYLRQTLKNSSLALQYNRIEAAKASFTDNKSVFDELTKENQSLVKFRKMFGLDIDF
ncbi:MAG: hypothetical protein R3279_10880 [Putridiphycobacter sp.]|nr:hypothetical protein [Putridiphycobacter sp.]